MVEEQTELKKLKNFNFFNWLKISFCYYFTSKTRIFNQVKKLKIFNFFISYIFYIKWIQGLETPAQEHFSCTGGFSYIDQISKTRNYI